MHSGAATLAFRDRRRGVEPLLARITASGHGVAGLSIARPGLHDAFVHIVRQVDAGFAADAAKAAAEASA